LSPGKGTISQNLGGWLSLRACLDSIPGQFSP
jgi:hypothetical protein